MTESELIRDIARDLAVEVGEECDKNFARKAFFDRPWTPVKVHNPRGSLMLRTGALRASLRYIPTAKGLEVSSDLPYAAIHNQGGIIAQNIPITDKMRRWAWARYYALKDPKYKALALTRKATIRRNIHIPARPFVGDHPHLRRAIGSVANEHVSRYAKDLLQQLKRR